MRRLLDNGEEETFILAFVTAQLVIVDITDATESYVGEVSAGALVELQSSNGVDDGA